MYRVYNIGISKYPDACPITIGTHSGIEIELTFKNYSTILKSLGIVGDTLSTCA